MIAVVVVSRDWTIRDELIVQIVESLNFDYAVAERIGFDIELDLMPEIDDLRLDSRESNQADDRRFTRGISGDSVRGLDLAESSL